MEKNGSNKQLDSILLSRDSISSQIESVIALGDNTKSSDELANALTAANNFIEKRDEFLGGVGDIINQRHKTYENLISAELLYFYSKKMLNSAHELNLSKDMMMEFTSGDPEPISAFSDRLKEALISLSSNKNIYEPVEIPWINEASFFENKFATSKKTMEHENFSITYSPVAGYRPVSVDNIYFESDIMHYTKGNNDTYTEAFRIDSSKVYYTKDDSNNYTSIDHDIPLNAGDTPEVFYTYSEESGTYSTAITVPANTTFYTYEFIPELSYLFTGLSALSFKSTDNSLDAHTFHGDITFKEENRDISYLNISDDTTMKLTITYDQDLIIENGSEDFPYRIGSYEDAVKKAFFSEYDIDSNVYFELTSDINVSENAGEKLYINGRVRGNKFVVNLNKYTGKELVIGGLLEGVTLELPKSKDFLISFKEASGFDADSSLIINKAGVINTISTSISPISPLVPYASLGMTSEEYFLNIKLFGAGGSIGKHNDKTGIQVFFKDLLESAPDEIPFNISYTSEEVSGVASYSRYSFDFDHETGNTFVSFGKQIDGAFKDAYKVGESKSISLVLSVDGEAAEEADHIFLSVGSSDDKKGYNNISSYQLPAGSIENVSDPIFMENPSIIEFERELTTNSDVTFGVKENENYSGRVLFKNLLSSTDGGKATINFKDLKYKDMQIFDDKDVELDSISAASRNNLFKFSAETNDYVYSVSGDFILLARLSILGSLKQIKTSNLTLKSINFFREQLDGLSTDINSLIGNCQQTISNCAGSIQLAKTSYEFLEGQRSTNDTEYDNSFLGQDVESAIANMISELSKIQSADTYDEYGVNTDTDSAAVAVENYTIQLMNYAIDIALGCVLAILEATKYIEEYLVFVSDQTYKERFRKMLDVVSDALSANTAENNIFTFPIFRTFSNWLLGIREYSDDGIFGLGQLYISQELGLNPNGYSIYSTNQFAIALKMLSNDAINRMYRKKLFVGFNKKKMWNAGKDNTDKDNPYTVKEFDYEYDLLLQYNIRVSDDPSMEKISPRITDLAPTLESLNDLSVDALLVPTESDDADRLRSFIQMGIIKYLFSDTNANNIIERIIKIKNAIWNGTLNFKTLLIGESLYEILDYVSKKGNSSYLYQTSAEVEIKAILKELPNSKELLEKYLSVYIFKFSSSYSSTGLTLMYLGNPSLVAFLYNVTRDKYENEFNKDTTTIFQVVISWIVNLWNSVTSVFSSWFGK